MLEYHPAATGETNHPRKGTQSLPSEVKSCHWRQQALAHGPSALPLVDEQDLW